jgi:signal transduction histidine kinase
MVPMSQHFGNAHTMLRQFFKLNPPALANEEQAEFGQTRVRIAMLAVISSYVFFMGLRFDPTFSLAPWAQTILLYYVFYTPLAVALFIWARKRPGHYPARRMASMFLDYGSLGHNLVVAPMQMMPLHTVILWVTMGHGLRFGRRYLWIATAFAMTTITIVCALIPKTEAAPFMYVLLMLSAVAIPQYANSLLNRVEQARADAEAANKAKSQFLAQASHDLRQPLHAINLFLVSLQQTGLKTAQKQIVDRIDRSLQGVANLFRSLLDVSTLDSGAIKPKLEPVALNDILGDVVHQNMQLAEWSDTDLRYVPSKQMVLTDRALLTTMVQNLVSNALKFAQGKSVLVGSRRNGDMLSVVVLDQGNGIAAEHLPRVFDEFFQVRKSGDPDRQGVGLGLSIVVRMAKLLKLAVNASSVPGRGSSFAISGLPRVGVASGVARTPEKRSQSLPLAGFGVLLVEDDADILVATGELLESWGCTATISTTVPTERGNYDLVITDYDLGSGQTGADCIATVRALCGWEVPAIVITGHDEGRIVDEIADSKIPVLKKPLRPSEMRSAIGAARARLRETRNEFGS